MSAYDRQGPDDARRDTPEDWHECSHSDAIVASFLDASRADASPFLAAHLDECPRCAQVLRLQRRIDALIASRTSTELDEGRADAFLSFLHEAPAERDAPAEREAPRAAPAPSPAAAPSPDRADRLGLRVPRLLGAAGLLAAASVVAALIFTKRDVDRSGAHLAKPSAEDAVPEDVVASGDLAARGDLAAHRARASERRIDASARGVREPAQTRRESAEPRGFALPEGFAIRRKRRGAPSQVQILRAFEGYYVAGMRSEMLADCADRIFAHDLLVEPRVDSFAVAACETLSPAGSRDANDEDFGPRRVHAVPEIRCAAALWYGHRIADQSRFCKLSELWLDFVLDARGKDRLSIVRGLCHDATEILERLPSARQASFAGALGLRISRDELREWSLADCVDYVREAMCTGDETRVDAALKLYVAASRRLASFAEHCRPFVREHGELQTLVWARVDALRAQLRRRSDERALDALASKLELASTGRMRTD